MDVTLALRFVPLLLSALFAVPDTRALLDAAVARLWTGVLDTPLFHRPLAEALVATFGFWFGAGVFETLHLAFPAVLDTKLGERRSAPHKMVKSVGYFVGTKVTGSVVYLAAIALFHALVRAKPPLPQNPPTFARLVSELAVGVFLYDLCFTPLHWLMHNGPTYLRHAHKVHHEAGGRISAGDTVRHSLIDGGLQVGVNILVQFVTPWGSGKHPLSRFLHNLIVTWLLCEAHSGYDLPWMSHRVFPGICGGAPRHQIHHTKGVVYYQQFFCWIDDCFGTVEHPSPAKLS